MDQDSYAWVDQNGHPVSPPPDDANSNHLNDNCEVSSRSSINLLKGSDEQKVSNNNDNNNDNNISYFKCNLSRKHISIT